MACQNQLTPIIGVCQARMYLWEMMSVWCAYSRSVTARIPGHHCHSQLIPQETMVLPTPLRPIHVHWKYYQAAHHRDFPIFPQPAHELQVCQRPGASRRLLRLLLLQSLLYSIEDSHGPSVYVTRRAVVLLPQTSRTSVPGH